MRLHFEAAGSRPKARSVRLTLRVDASGQAFCQTWQADVHHPFVRLWISGVNNMLLSSCVRRGIFSPLARPLRMFAAQWSPQAARWAFGHQATYQCRRRVRLDTGEAMSGTCESGGLHRCTVHSHRRMHERKRFTAAGEGGQQATMKDFALMLSGFPPETGPEVTQRSLGLLQFAWRFAGRAASRCFHSPDYRARIPAMGSETPECLRFHGSC